MGKVLEEVLLDVLIEIANDLFGVHMSLEFFGLLCETFSNSYSYQNIVILC